MARYTMLERPSACPQAQPLYSISFSVSVAHSSTVHVPWLHVSGCLEEGVC